jgi:glycerol-3-phosphate O-acyltransferase
LYRHVTWNKYDDYVGARIFTPYMKEIFKKRILDSERVRKAIFELAHSRTGTFQLWRLNRQSKHLVDSMIANIDSKNIILTSASIINIIINRIYHQGIHIKESDIYKIRQTAMEAESRNISLIFLPCHRSHMDYIILSYLFFRLGISLPFIAAGDNLNLPIIGNLLRRGGAFFIKRKFDKNLLYDSIFKEYIECLLESGFNMEAFVEGSRSRTGKLLSPKFGILKVIIKSLLSGRVSDVYMIPISIGYDKVIETSSYVDELLGVPKETESLISVFASTKVFQLRLGRVDISFATPFSLKQYIEEQVNRRANFNPRDIKDDTLLLLRSLGYKICSDINQVAIIMPTTLIATIILSFRGRGIDKEEVIHKYLQGWILHLFSLIYSYIVDK